MVGFALVILSIFLLGANFTSSAAPIDDVSLGQAASYSILAGTALTKGDMSSISGAPSDAGIFPGTVAPDVAALFASTGASSFHNGDAAAGLAQGDLVTAIAAIASNLSIVTSVYIWVVVTEACPRSSCTTLTSAPPSSRWVAYE